MKHEDPIERLYDVNNRSYHSRLYVLALLIIFLSIVIELKILERDAHSSLVIFGFSINIICLLYSYFLQRAVFFKNIQSEKVIHWIRSVNPDIQPLLKAKRITLLAVALGYLILILAVMNPIVSHWKVVMLFSCTATSHMFIYNFIGRYSELSLIEAIRKD